MSVIGLDISLTGTGIAHVSSGAGALTRRVRSVGKRADSTPDRHARIRRIVDDVTLHAAPALLVVEGPAFASHGGSAHDRSGLWWALVSHFIDQGTPVAVVPPTTRAKWATGKGNADKVAVVGALARLLPDLVVGSSDEADATILALMGLHALGGLPDHMATRYREDALCACEWPLDVAAGVIARYGKAEAS